MEASKPKRSREAGLAEISAAHEKRHALALELLRSIKDRRHEIISHLNVFKKEEPDLIYRFYHQSFKAFIMVDIIRRSDELFESLAPESTKLNSWYVKITQAALSKKFDFNTTNQKWLEETLPISQAFWHSKYFLEQMLAAADDIDEAPQILPSGWAAVLYLYGLR